jgi:hypothetical protein
MQRPNNDFNITCWSSSLNFFHATALQRQDH